MAMNYRIYVDTGVSGFAELPVPGAMTYGLQDISAANAGRTESTMMMKDRIGKAPKIELTYNNQYTDTITTALSLVKNEYIYILYQDLENGGEYAYGEFYRGDVTAQVYNGVLDVWSSTKFSLIKRDGKPGVACVSHTSVSLPGDSSTASVSTSALTMVSTVSSIIRKGSIGVSESTTNNYVITRIGGGELDATVIFKNASGQTIIVEVVG